MRWQVSPHAFLRSRRDDRKRDRVLRAQVILAGTSSVHIERRDERHIHTIISRPAFSGDVRDCYLLGVPDSNRREVRTALAPSPAFSYSQGIIFKDLVFIAGQVPRHPETGNVPVGLADQVRQTLDNLSAVAAAAGTALERAVRVNVYLEDLATIGDIDEIYRSYFTTPYPVRTTVQVGLRGYLIEIDAIVAL